MTRVLPWLKFDPDLRHDPRLAHLSVSEQYFLEDLMGLSRYSDDGKLGVVTLTIEQIKGRWKRNERFVESFLRKCAATRLLADSKYGQIILARWLFAYHDDGDMSPVCLGGFDTGRGWMADQALAEAREAAAQRQARKRSSDGVTAETSARDTGESDGVTAETSARDNRNDSRGGAQEAEADERIKRPAGLPLRASAEGMPPEAAPDGYSLTAFQEKDLTHRGWSLLEIDEGLKIIRQRGKVPKSLCGLLMQILPEVREGRRAKVVIPPAPPKRLQIKPISEPPPMPELPPDWKDKLRAGKKPDLPPEVEAARRAEMEMLLADPIAPLTIVSGSDGPDTPQEGEWICP